MSRQEMKRFTLGREMAPITFIPEVKEEGSSEADQSIPDSEEEKLPEKILEFKSLPFEWVDKEGKIKHQPLYLTINTPDFVFQYSFWQQLHQWEVSHPSDLPFCLGHAATPSPFPTSQPSLVQLMPSLLEDLQEDNLILKEMDMPTVNSRVDRRSLLPLTLSPEETPDPVRHLNRNQSSGRLAGGSPRNQEEQAAENKRKRKLFRAYLEGLYFHINSCNELHFSPVSFLPNTDKLYELDISELSSFLNKKQTVRNQYYARGAIVWKKGVENPVEWWKMGVRTFCHGSICGKAKWCLERGVEGANILTEMVQVVRMGGLFDDIMVDKKDNFSKLLFTFCVLMDTVPALRRQVATELQPLLDLLNRNPYDLFDLEKTFHVDKKLMDSLVLYFMTETDRLNQTYHRAKTLLEYLVKTDARLGELGLLMGDLLELEMMVNNLAPEGEMATYLAANRAKQIDHYTKSYKAKNHPDYNHHISLASLSRLTTLHHRSFEEMQAREPENLEGQICLYREIFHAHHHMAQISNTESMRFLLDHYYRCRGYVTGELRPKTSCQRALENLHMSRRRSLEESLKYFEYFYYMGERDRTLLEYYKVLSFLHYVEASLAALRYAVLSEGTKLSCERFTPYALCKMEGIGTNMDLNYACQVIKGNFMQNCQVFFPANFIISGVCLYEFGVILSRFPSLQNEERTTRLFMYALAYFLASHNRNEVPSKKFIYYILKVMEELKHKSDLWDMYGEKLQGVISGCSEIAALDSRDLLYQYRIEEETIHLFYQYESFREKEKQKKEEDRKKPLEETQTPKDLSYSKSVQPQDKSKDFASLHKRELPKSSALPTLHRATITIPISNFAPTPEKSMSEDPLATLTKFHYHQRGGPGNEKCIEKTRDLVGSLESYLIKRNITLSKEIVRNQLIKIVDECVEEIAFQQNPNGGKNGLLMDKSPSRRIQAKRLTQLANKEEEIDKEGMKTKGTTLEAINQLMVAVDQKSTFDKMLADNPFIRVFEDREILIDETDKYNFADSCTVYKATILHNNQLCRVFQVALETQTAVEAFFKNCIYIQTSSPFFLNYYGIYSKVKEGKLHILVLSEYFEQNLTFKAQVSSPGGRSRSPSKSPENRQGSYTTTQSLWTDKTLPKENKWMMFHDLLMAIQCLHFTGKPHLFLTPSHMVTIRNKTRLKVIIPFFMPYYGNPKIFYDESTRVPDLYYLCPSLFQSKVFPQEDFKFLDKTESPQSSAFTSFLGCDMWPIGVSYLEIITCQPFGDRSGYKTQKHFLNAMELDKKMGALVEAEIGAMKRMNLPNKPYLKEMYKVMASRSSDRICINQIILLMEEFLRREDYPGGAEALLLKRKERYYTREVFGCSQFADPSLLESKIHNNHIKDSFLQHSLAQGSYHAQNAHNVSAVGMMVEADRIVFLPNGLEFIGKLNKEGYPQDLGIIRRKRRVIIEGKFKDGLLAKWFIFTNPFGDKMKIVLDERGKVSSCNLIPVKLYSGMKSNEQIKLIDTLAPDKFILTHPDKINELFQNFQNRKTYQEIVEAEGEKAESSEDEVKDKALDNIANLLLGNKGHPKGAPSIPRERKKTRITSIILKSPKEDFSGRDESIELEEGQNEEGGENSAVLNKKLSVMKIPEVLLAVSQYTAAMKKLLGGDFDITDSSPVKTAETDIKYGLRVEAPKQVIFFDPFGYSYRVLYSKATDRIHYSDGMMRTSTLFDRIWDRQVIVPKLSSYFFLDTTLFQHSLVESSTPLLSFPVLFSRTDKNNHFGWRAIASNLGTLFLGKGNGVSIRRGDLFTPEKTLHLKEARGDITVGSVMVSTGTASEKLRYKGEMKRGQINGWGVVRGKDRLGKSVKKYEGHFREDLPHGFGVMVDRDREGKDTQDAFIGYFFDGAKCSGTLEKKFLNVEGMFFVPITNSGDPQRNALSTGLLPLVDCLKLNSRTFDVTGWVVPKEGGTIKFGRFNDSSNDFTGFFQVNFPDGGCYKGNFEHSHRHGPFIMATSQGDYVAGIWNEYSFRGGILWNKDHKIRTSQGDFRIDLKGNIEQVKYGRVVMKDGSVYQGEMRENMFNGVGRLVFPTGSYYEGEFKNGLYDGWGENYDRVLEYTYIGEFRSGKEHGAGILKVKSESITLHGVFEEGVCRRAVVGNPSHTIYGRPARELATDLFFDQKLGYDLTGQCRAILEPSKEDRERDVSSMEYSGQIDKEQITGCGVLTQNGVVLYEGSIENGSLNGFGRLNIGPMKYYCGKFVNNVCTGTGYLKDHVKMYQGDFINLMKNGMFLVMYKKDKWMLGEFKDDEKHGYFLVKNIEGVASNGEPTITRHTTKFSLEKYTNGKLDSKIDIPDSEPPAF